VATGEEQTTQQPLQPLAAAARTKSLYAAVGVGVADADLAVVRYSVRVGTNQKGQAGRGMDWVAIKASRKERTGGAVCPSKRPIAAHR
jgi:hypothetical protein